MVRNLRRLRRAAHVGFALSRMETRSRGRGARARGRCRRGRRPGRCAWRGPAPGDFSCPLSPWPARRGRLHARALARHHRHRRLPFVQPRHGRRDPSRARAERRSPRIDEAARHRRHRDARRARRRSARLGAARARRDAEAHAHSGSARSRARLQSRRDRDRAPGSARRLWRGAGEAAARRLPAGDRGGRSVARGVCRAARSRTRKGRGPVLRRGRLRAEARPQT